MGVDRAIDITAKERKIVLDLLQRYLPGVEAWVYGSRAKWTSRPQSDLDLVVFATPEQSRRVGDLREGFEESNLPFRVDLFVWSEVPKQFHHEIERDHVVLMKVVPVSVDVNWPIITLGDCIDINDSTYSPKEAWSFVNYLDTGNITENCISEIQHLKTGIDTLPSRARRKVRPGDIVYSTVRPNQKHFGYLKKVPENFLVSTGFSVIRGISGVACTNYIYWFLAQSHIVDHLHTVAEHSTSAYPSIRPTDIERLTLRLPPISEQRTIAYILGTLDDKIELNRRMNETLEAMAHALFKSWFVDFDPVRAKMALNHSPSRESNWTVVRARAYLDRMDPKIADLFPDRHVDSELGEIPEGWRVTNLDQLLLEAGLKTQPSQATLAKPYVPIDCIASKSLALYEAKDGTEAKSSLVSFRKGDFLFGSMRPYFHKVCIAPFDGTTRTTCLVLNSKQPEYYAFSLFLIYADSTIEFATQNSTGSTIPYIKWEKELETLQLIKPSKLVVEVFGDVVNPVLKKFNSAIEERNLLIKLRDTLLPKLISGEMRVDDKVAVEAVV